MIECLQGIQTWINQVADRFEQEWVAGQRPRIEDYLADVSEPRRSCLLEELLHVECELRQRAGERLSREEFRRRFPGYIEVIDGAFDPSSAAPRTRRRSPMAAAADRNLLFGILALQMDFITRDALIASMHAWVLEKQKPLGRILVAHGALAESQYDLLDAIVKAHLKQHGDNPEKSLASLSSIGSVRKDLEGIADPDIHAGLPGISSTRIIDEVPYASCVDAAGRSHLN